MAFCLKTSFINFPTGVNNRLDQKSEINTLLRVRVRNYNDYIRASQTFVFRNPFYDWEVFGDPAHIKK